MTQVYIFAILLLISIIGCGIFFLSSKTVYQTLGVIIAALSLTDVFLVKDYNPLRDEYSNTDYAYKPSVYNPEIIDEPYVEPDTIEVIDINDPDVYIDSDDPEYIDIEYQDGSDEETEFTFIEGDGRGGLAEFDEDYYSL